MPNLPAVRARRPTEPELGLLRRQVGRIADTLGRKQIPIPSGTGAGWGPLGSTTDLGSKISRYIDTYGGDTPVTWIYACVRLIFEEMAIYDYSFVDPRTASDLSKCGKYDYKKVPNDLKELCREPNPFMTWSDFISYKEMDTELAGNSYWLKDERNALGQPKTLLRLRPEFTTIATNRRGEVIGFVYRVKGVLIPFDVDEIIHFRVPSPHSDYYGMGTVQGILPDAGAEIGINEHVVGFFTNGARISGVLTISGTLTEEAFERIKRQFREEYGGSANAFSILIAEQGLEFSPVTQTPAAAGVKELRELDKDAILSGFRVHAEMLGGNSNAGDVKMGDAQKIFTRSMRPRAVRTSERLTYSLTTLWGDVGIWISTTGIETQEVKVARARDMLGAGATVSEARVEQGLTPVTPSTFPHLGPEEIRMANMPILPSGYDPFFVVQQAPGGVLPGGSNGNASGTVQPTAEAGSEDRDRVRAFRSLNGRGMLALGDGSFIALPDGFEEIGDYEVREADADDAENLVAIQARVYGDEAKDWELEMVGFFNEQRNRILREVGKFVDRHNAKRLGKLEKRDLSMERIWHQLRENDLLDSLYRARARGVAQRVVNEIAELFGSAVPDVRTIADELAQRVEGINETTRERIARQIAVGIARGYSTQQIANGVPDENYLGVAGVFDSATETRALLIARTETATVYNLASLSAYRQIGVQRVEVIDGEMDEGCRLARGDVWTVERAAAEPIEHPNCVRSFAPIFAGTGRA